MNKESWNSRKQAEENYNELFSLTNRKEEILKELKKINKKLEILNKNI